MRAWYLLSQVVDDESQAAYCLERAAKLDPDNIRIAQRLSELDIEPTDLTPEEFLLPLSTSQEPSVDNQIFNLIVAGAVSIIVICVICVGLTLLVNALGLFDSSTPVAVQPEVTIIPTSTSDLTSLSSPTPSQFPGLALTVLPPATDSPPPTDPPIPTLPSFTPRPTFTRIDTPLPTQPSPTRTPTPTTTHTGTPRPTITPTRTPTPIPPVIFQYSGAGNSVLDLDIEAVGGFGVLQINGNQGRQHFSVLGYDENGSRTELYVNTTEPYSGRRAINLKGSENTVRLEISATGSWQIDLLSLSEDLLTVMTVPGSNYGTGDDVLVLKGLIPDKARVIGNSTARHFSLIAFIRHASGWDLLINTTSPYSSEVLMEPDSYVLEFTAAGEWRIEISSK